MNLPRVLIVSTIPEKADELALSLGAERLSDQNEVKYYVWQIDNKYYTSQVLLCATEDPCMTVSVENTEALIVHHDPQIENAEQKLDQWSPIISSMSDADVLLFSCNPISDVHVRDKVAEWCLQRKFELVELSDNTEDAQPDPECDHQGIQRIIEALHAHMWPNMTLKEKPVPSEELQPDINEMEEQFDNIQLTQDPMERLRMESVLDGIMGGENSDFGELFSQLMAMKEHAASLPMDQRRIAAEQLVTAFWKAMGGDSSEIED